MPITFTETNVEQKFNLRIDNFYGGLNTRDLDSKVADNELTDVRNFNFDKRAALSIRKGFAKLNAVAIGSVPIKSLGGYYKTSSTAEKIATAGTQIYSASSTTFSSIATGLTSGLVFDMHQFMNKYFMANGTDACRVYNGTTTYTAGYTAPSSGVTATQGSTGVLEAKTYQYKVTYYYEDGESNANTTATSILIAASKKIELTNIPVSASARVTQRKLYRTVGDGTTFKLLTTINDNTTTTYSDNTPDSGLGADLEEDNDAPPTSAYVISHKNRMWYVPANSSTIYASKALHPEAVPSDYYWDIGKDDGDIVTGVAVNLGALVIFKQYSTWVITGDIPFGDDADMVLEKVNPTHGCVSFRTVKPAGNDLFFLTPNLGVQRLHRIILASTESFDAEALSSKIEDTINGLNSSYLSISHAVVYDHRYYLFVPNSTSTTCNICLVLNLRRLDPDDETTIAWTIYDNMNFGSSCLFLDGNGEYFYAGTNASTGYVYQLETGNRDDGTAIQAYATTKYFELGDFNYIKVPQFLHIHARASEDYSFTVRRFHNYKNTEEQYTKDLSGGGVVSDNDVLYDTVLYDSVLYDADGEYTNTVVDIMKSIYVNKPCQKIKFKIESVYANDEFKFFGFNLYGYVAAMAFIE